MMTGQLGNASTSALLARMQDVRPIPAWSIFDIVFDTLRLGGKRIMKLEISLLLPATADWLLICQSRPHWLHWRASWMPHQKFDEFSLAQFFVTQNSST